MKTLANHIVFDCDDVLLDWTQGFHDYLTYLGRPPATSHPSSWDLTDWLGENPSDLVKDFNSSRHFAELKPLTDAREAVLTLNAAGFEISVVTCCGIDSVTVDRRHSNLRGIFGNAIKRIICLPLGMSKAEILAGWTPGVFIDDHVKHVEAAHQLGYASYLMNRPHNVHEKVPEGVLRTRGFEPFVGEILFRLMMSRTKEEAGHA